MDLFKRNSVLISLLLLIGFVAPAQSSQRLDSLKNDINTAPNDSLRIEALVEYMRVTLNNNTTDFLPYLAQLVQLGKKTNNKWGLSSGYIVSLSYYADRGEFAKALIYGDSAYAVLKGDTTEDGETNMAHLHNNRGNCYYMFDDYENAMKNYMVAVPLFEKYEHQSLASVLTGISNCFNALGDFDKAILYSEKAISFAKDKNDKRLLAVMMMNKSNVLMHMGNYRAADSMLNIVAPIVSALQNTTCLHVYSINKGDVEAYYKKDTVKALYYFQLAYKYARENEDVTQIVAALGSVVNFQLDLNQLEAARKNLDILINLAEKNGMDDSRSDIMESYAIYYQKKGDYQNAFKYLMARNKLADSLDKQQTMEQVQKMEVRFQVAEHQNTISQLKAVNRINQLTIRQKNTLNYILIGGAVALFAISLLSYRNYRHRQRLQQQRISELETEKQLTATEAILKGEEKERSRLAKDLHDGLGGMLSGIKFSLNNMKDNLILTPDNAQSFERSIHLLDNSIQEMRRVAHNLMPEALLKFGLDEALRDFCSEMAHNSNIRIVYQSFGLKDRDMDQSLAVTIYRVSQELLNNIIKHADASQAILQVSSDDHQINITVEDNGKGIDQQKLREASGIGWKNIESRIAYYKGAVQIESDEGKGTSVYIEFLR